MGRHRKRVESSQSSGSSDSDQSCIESSDSSDSSLEIEYERLSTKDLKKLLKLEKAIKKEEQILKRDRIARKREMKSKKKKTEKRLERSDVSFDKILDKVSPHPIVEQGKKLFITGIDEKHSYEEVMNQLGQVLKNISGVTDYRIKQKKGCRTYAFVDFVNYGEAHKGINTLRKKCLFGEKIAVYYSQDQLKGNSHSSNQMMKPADSGQKRCFECNEEGHFQRECKKRLNPVGNKLDLDGSLQFNPGWQCMVETAPEPINEKKEIDKIIEDKHPNKRVIRERSRLNRLENS